MPVISANTQDIQFVADELLQLEKHYQQLPPCQDMDAETFAAVVEEANRFLLETAGPLNRNADEQGCTLQGDKVTTPDGFKALYKQYCDDGWNGLDAPTEYGGQGLPYLLAVILGELNTYYCPAWADYPMLGHGAREALTAHGSDFLKQTYMPKLTTGQWTGTMCLTEPHCGTDLGLLKTQAVPQEDGTYAITGTKIFITSGEHDLAENIIHLVLARLPDAPPGTKGISMFVVPKFIPDENNQPGIRNAVSCGSLEHKMGLKGSSTCVMNFDGATGWLVGEENRGLNHMFTMMNGARISTGVQGLAVSQAAYQGAVQYARERLQSRSLAGPKYPDKPADPIIVHPDVRRMLLTMKALAEGNRALAYFTAQQIEKTRYSDDENVRRRAAALQAFLTPIVKAFITESGIEATNLGVQVYGGHGYIREHGMEQLIRDGRIFTLYEGTTGIQALDLLGRKLLKMQGGQLGPIAEEIQAFIDQHPNSPYVDTLRQHLHQWQQLSQELAAKAQQNPEEIGAASVDFLMFSGYVLLAWLWARMAEVATQQLDADGPRGKNFYRAKQKTAEFYFNRILPRAAIHAATLRSGADNLMAMAEEEF